MPTGVTQFAGLCFQTAFWRDANFYNAMLGEVSGTIRHLPPPKMNDALVTISFSVYNADSLIH